MKTKFLRWPIAVRVVLLIVLLSLFFAFAAMAQAEAQTEQEVIGPSAGTTYTVQFGDTLAGIAYAAYGVGEYYEPLCSYNELSDCHTVRVGSQIIIPLLQDLGELPTVPETEATPQSQASALETPVATVATPTPEPEPVATLTPEPTPVDPDPALSAVPEEMRVHLRTVIDGDTLEGIAIENYNNETLAGRLCAYNQLPDCTILESGVRIFTPVLDELLFGEPHMFLTPAPTIPLETPTAVPPAEIPAATPDISDTPSGSGAENTPTPVSASVQIPVTPESIPSPLLGGSEGELTLSQYIGLDARLEICAYLLEQTTVPQVLSSNGPYTLFLPSDSAWVATETELIQRLLTNEDTLDSTLRSYVVPGEFSFQDLSRLESVTSLDGREWLISTDSDGTLKVGEARINESTSEPVNGTIHFLSLVQP